ncbi:MULTISPECIES: hypothetical protein [Bacillus]|uniref:hypothetical protein n=1 Tax=Bacillus TaxID=1386 RepID=UPI001581C808|nr:hypothetical protein [Bacillus glycinifermentans]MBU8788821.1 hypothetical protein [Bacillus glycinifermentans]NUJ19238.1 hypothetical protein [Bacillus glycinifermentans]
MTRKSIACTEAIADFPIIKDCDEEDINHKFRIKNGEVTVFGILRWEEIISQLMRKPGVVEFSFHYVTGGDKNILL